MNSERGVESREVVGVAPEVGSVGSGAEMRGGTEVSAERVSEGRGSKDGVGMPVGMPPATVDGVAVRDGAVVQSVSVNITTKDSEGIEKGWIAKVREVLDGTRQDPRKREDEIYGIKKDFIFKRFGRKIGEGKEK